MDYRLTDLFVCIGYDLVMISRGPAQIKYILMTAFRFVNQCSTVSSVSLYQQ